MSASWPAGLPQAFDGEGYGESLSENSIRSKPDMGPAKVRRRYTAVVESIKGTMTMSQAQWITLRTFFITTLASGSLPFDWTHPSTGSAVSMRFVKPPAMQVLNGFDLKVNLDLEVLP